MTSNPLIRRVAVTAVTAAVVVVGSALPASPKTASGPTARAVVSIVDTGINPYHVTFRDDSPLARRHPSTYIPGYPSDAIPLKLSLNEKDYWTAVKKDCERVWAKVKTGKLYWFPGTKIVGAISFEGQSGIDCNSERPAGAGRILDVNGHGTMSASRAASSEYGGCKECLVVGIQFSANVSRPEEAISSISWAADNGGWIDLQSNSWGPFLPVWDPTGAGGMIGATPELVRKVEEVSAKQAAFWASGNGSLFRLGGIGHPTSVTPHFTPSAIMVGGHDSGYVTAWPGFPAHVVSDACGSWAAFHREIDKSAEDHGSGTSAATPYAAGGAARILLEARHLLVDTDTGIDRSTGEAVVAQGPAGKVAAGPLADGTFTLDEWKRLTLVTASPRPQGQKEDGPPCDLLGGAAIYSATPVKWTDVPDGYPEYLHIGYGAVDDQAFELAAKVLAGTEEAPDRTTTDDFFAADGQARRALHDNVWTKP